MTARVAPHLSDLDRAPAPASADGRPRRRAALGGGDPATPPQRCGSDARYWP
jgi:hypothetical protein